MARAHALGRPVLTPAALRQFRISILALEVAGPKAPCVVIDSDQGIHGKWFAATVHGFAFDITLSVIQRPAVAFSEQFGFFFRQNFYDAPWIRITEPAQLRASPEGEQNSSRWGSSL